MVTENVALSDATGASKLAAVVDFNRDILTGGKQCNQFVFLPVFEVKTIGPLQFFNGKKPFYRRRESCIN